MAEREKTAPGLGALEKMEEKNRALCRKFSLRLTDPETQSLLDDLAREHARRRDAIGELRG